MYHETSMYRMMQDPTQALPVDLPHQVGQYPKAILITMAVSWVAGMSRHSLEPGILPTGTDPTKG